MAMLIDGKSIAATLKASLKKEIEGFKAVAGRAPRLVALQFGENASSAVYAKAQKIAAKALGIEYDLKFFPATTSQLDAEAAVIKLNADAAVSAIIIQLPVPKKLDAKRLVGLIAPGKDAEGMHPYNLGKILLGNYQVGPCSAMAVIELLESTKVKLYGKEALVVGHSEIVGKPLALMLLAKFATTTVCHIATSERGVLADHVKRAEVLVVAVGKAGVVRGEWVKEGAIVIDVGINRVGERIVGDVEFEAAAKRASAITPVPGGVGPLTTMILMRNTLALAKAQRM